MASRTRQPTDKSLQQRVRRVMRELEWESGQDAPDGMSGAETADTVGTARRVLGVRNVTDEIKVKPAGAHERDDCEIAEAAARLLRWNDLVPDNVEVEVRRGFVTLRGEVEWAYQREAATRTVRNLVGVSGVADHIDTPAA